MSDALDDVLVHIDRELGRPLRDILFAADGSEEEALLDETAFTQPALFALGWVVRRFSCDSSSRRTISSGDAGVPLKTAETAKLWSSEGTWR